ncbi:hypothetical protein EC957_011200, partial [Mortierella hygrophila]
MVATPAQRKRYVTPPTTPAAGPTHKKQRRAATFNNVDRDEDDNSDNSDSNDDSHDDGDCRPFNMKIRAEIVRMAKSSKNLPDLEKPMGPGRAKQPYYRMTLARKMQHRRLKQGTPAEDENDDRPCAGLYTNKVFTDYVIKRIAPGTSYKGIVGFKRPGYTDPSLDQPGPAKKQGQEQIVDVDVDSLDSFMKSKHLASDLSKLCNWTFMEQPTEPKGTEPVDDGGAGSSTTQQQWEGTPEMSQDNSKNGENVVIPPVAMIGSIAEKTQVLENAPVDMHGKKLLRIPPAYGTTETALKAMRARTCTFPNNERSPRDDPLIRKAYRDYRRCLVYDEVFKGSTRQGSGLVRDPYTERQLITMLAFTWRQQASLPAPLPPNSMKEKRSYDTTSRFPHIREHFCIAARHHMVLRDEDLRNMNLSDCSSIDETRYVPGSERAAGLGFCFHKGKTNPDGKRVYAAAFRNKNFIRCPVGAFAFYMLERFQIEQDYDNDGMDPYWRDTCVREMQGHNPDKVDDKDTYDDRILPAASASNSTDARTLTDRRKFLILLLRMRKVILQDAVLYLEPNSKGQTLTNKLLRLDLFSSDAFKDFQLQLLEAIESHRLKDPIISTKVPIDGPALTTGINVVGSSLKEMSQ